MTASGASSPHAAVQVALLRAALARRPESSGLTFDLAQALLEVGDEAAAARTYRQAAMLSPGSRFPGAEMAQALVRQGVTIPQALAGLALAAGQAGREAEVRHLVDYDRFIRRVELAPPGGYTRAEFHRELADELRRDLTFYSGDGREPSKNCWQNNKIIDSASPAWSAYRQVLLAEIDHYVEAVCADGGHPFTAARPQGVRLDAHALISGEGGHIGAHFHPRAWITCVYYVVSPRSARREGSHEGWLSIEPPPGYAGLPGWDVRLAPPDEGTLLIMPGYFFHRTLPVLADEERISLVVDVMDEGFPLQSAYRTKKS